MSVLKRLKIVHPLNLDANVLRIADLFTGKTDVQRPEYAAVFVEPAAPLRGAYVVAMDGACICVQYDPSAAAQKSLLVSVSPSMSTQLKAGRRFIVTDENKVMIYTPGEPERAYSYKETMQFQPSKFVKWRKALPEDWSKLSPGYPYVLNATYLRRIAALHLEGSDNRRVNFLTYPSKLVSRRPALSIAIFPENSNLFVIIAPMDADPALAKEPSWLNPTADL